MNGPETNEGNRPLAAALYRIFSAIARVCLRRGFGFEAVVELAKRAFVDVAQHEFRLPNRKPSASRISVLTGIHRKEIGRVLGSPDPQQVARDNQITNLAALIAAWRRDSTFCGSRGNPKPLPFDSGSPCFAELVRRYGRGDVPPRAVLDEMVRVGAVTLLRDGKIRLQATDYVPGSSSAEGLSILGTDVSDLIAAIDHNLFNTEEPPFFQRKVAYNNLPEEALLRVQASLAEQGQALLEQLDRELADEDRDSNPKVRGTGQKRLMVGVYSYAHDHSDQSED